MPWFKDPKYFKQENNTAYDKIYRPGEVPAHSGIYRCESCGVEVVSEHSRKLPTTHAKTAYGHVINWRLVAYPHQG